ncbi:MAG TPA: tetratricopeptide repeat protein [Candidatus Saccharimonadales bacterium]|nr:tetratricopeptide repeat protein [Candidatus Saccharimonadales bacterium]
MIELMLQAERALTAGMIDQAERLYRQAIAHDPRNSIAIVGLARVALERDDDRTAYELARKALDVDPENAAAKRLATRMAEVLRYRGEVVPEDGPPSPAMVPPPTVASDTPAAASVAAPSISAPAAPPSAATPGSNVVPASPAAPPPGSAAPAAHSPARASSPARPGQRPGLVRRLFGRR